METYSLEDKNLRMCCDPLLFSPRTLELVINNIDQFKSNYRDYHIRTQKEVKGKCLLQQ